MESGRKRCFEEIPKPYMLDKIFMVCIVHLEENVIYSILWYIKFVLDFLDLMQRCIWTKECAAYC